MNRKEELILISKYEKYTVPTAHKRKTPTNILMGSSIFDVGFLLTLKFFI